ncbi:hypothetical protein A1O1_01165 [Capronia coronata CBS 617.96]|uniref:GATA-type domain-containing protein n=1 Tax=Capronia coronata CBS 617.96 TaxID=1182541 RepID=W9ZNI5_9EURO|nr:uncharacterized protein A1O1_01165 [Capronia coronata CBS 617.96]EXJ96039.1 hypothetical protein A1O1_01165 [Capronia coronata CBS 617.96]
MDAGTRLRDTLPPISHLDLSKINGEKHDHSRFSMMNGLSISTAPLVSPTTTMYPGPPPPYSCAPPATGSTAGLSGYISPPESTTRRSTRDEGVSPALPKSLPSIHEALGSDKPIAFPGPLPTSSQHQSLSNPSNAGHQSFSEGPKGPSNPFSQPPTGPPVLRDVFSGTPSNGPAPAETPNATPSYPPTTTADPRQAVSQHFGYPGSPRSNPANTFRSSSLANTSFNNHNDHPPATSPQSFEPSRQPQSFLPYGANATPSAAPASHESFHKFSAVPKPSDPRATYQKAANDVQYSETVKRHLDVYDAELGFNEISEACARTLDFSRTWALRYHQGSRSGYFHESLPGLPEVDEILRHSHRILENMTHLRELVVAQQTALSEQRARQTSRNHPEDEYAVLSEEFRGGGFTGADAKKRRGKAAPPGRCHSCNRAETPEWRRGPDGARTLCNACGLHYAKLTRKMGHNKAAALAGSTLRPKNLDSTRP